MKYILSFLCIFMLSLGVPATAQQKRLNQKQMEALLIIVSSDTSQLSANYQKVHKLKKSRADIMAKHYQAMLKDPKTRSAMAKILVKSMRGVNTRSAEEAEAKVSQRVSSSVLLMTQDGMKRMTKSSQLNFFKTTYPIFVKSSTKDCGTLFGNPRHAGGEFKAEMNTYNRISTQQLTNYFLFQRKSMEFSANNTGRPVKMKRAEKAKAEQIFASYFNQALLKHKNQAGILRSITKNPTATDKDYCDMGRMILKFVVNAPPEQGGLMARFMLLES